MMTPLKRQALLLAVVNAALDQPSPTPELGHALNTWLVASGDDLVASAPMRPLTRTEKSIADFVGRGFTDAQIAAVMNISSRTVETHIEHIAMKLPNPDMRTRKRLVAEWAQVPGVAL